MKITRKVAYKYFTETLAGVVVGSILGMLGLILGSNYGGRTGCPTFINAIFGTQGYESCGAFAAILGILIGIIITALFIKKINKNNNITNILSIVTLIVIPFLLVLLGMGIEDIAIVPPVILIFVLLTVIPSLIITLLVNWKMSFRQK